MAISTRSNDIAAARSDRRKRLQPLDRAYGCFAFLGLVTQPLGLAALLDKFGLIDFDKGLAEKLDGQALYLGLILGIPLVVGMLAASVYGIVRTVQFRCRGLPSAGGATLASKLETWPLNSRLIPSGGAMLTDLSSRMAAQKPFFGIKAPPPAQSSKRYPTQVGFRI